MGRPKPITFEDLENAGPPNRWRIHHDLVSYQRSGGGRYDLPPRDELDADEIADCIEWGIAQVHSFRDQGCPGLRYEHGDYAPSLDWGTSDIVELTGKLIEYSTVIENEQEYLEALSA